MTEAKHTPGPWTVDGPTTNQIVWSDQDNRVCFLAHSNGLNDERDKANGRLIAAAPDMLEALKTCRDALMSRCSIHDKTADGAIGEAWAAIEKATGG